MADPIYLLTNEPNPDDNVIIPIDKADFTDAKGTTRAQLLNDDRVANAASFAAIEDGAGLNPGGTLSPEPASNYLKNADYLAAGFDVNLRNSTLLLDAAIGNLAAANETIAQFELSSAEILALGAALTKLAAPGAGLVYHWYECDAALIYNTTDYVSAGANGIDVIFQGGSDQIVRLPKAFLEASATSRKKFLIASHELLTNTAIQAIAPDGNPINGDSKIIIRLEGRIQAELVPGGVTVPSTCCIQPLGDSFTAADLTGLGNLEVTHGLNTQSLISGLYDNTGASVAHTITFGDETGTDPNNIVTFTGLAGIPGTWTWILMIKNP